MGAIVARQMTEHFYFVRWGMVAQKEKSRDFIGASTDVVCRHQNIQKSIPRSTPTTVIPNECDRNR